MSSLKDLFNLTSSSVPTIQNSTSSAASPVGDIDDEGLLNDFIWNAVHSSPPVMTWWAVVGLMIKGILFGVVLMNVARYYGFFLRSDRKIVQFGIGLGACFSLAQIVLNAHQVKELINHASDDYASIARPDAWSTLAVTFYTAHVNAAATSFYSWRAWKLSGRKRYLTPLLVSGILVSYTVVWPVLIQGAKMPALVFANAAKLESWLLLDAKLLKAWGFISVGVDLCVCTLLVYLFLKSKQSMLYAQDRLVHKLLVLVFETMIPPTVVMLVLVCWTSQTGSQLTSFWRVLVWALPDLYFLSILHSLNSRRTIQSMLDNRSLSDQAKFLSMPTTSGKSSSTDGENSELKSATLGSTEIEFDTVRIPDLSSAASTPQRASGHSVNRSDGSGGVSRGPFTHWPLATKIEDDGQVSALTAEGTDQDVKAERRRSRRKPIPSLDGHDWGRTPFTSPV